MQLLLLLSALLACAVSSSIDYAPIPGDNRLYVDGKSRYIWMPDGDGNPHLVDLKAPVDESFFTSRNGANNAYWLFTRQNPYAAQIITINNVNSIRNSNYNGNRPTKVIVHGWNSNGNSAINPTITSAFLAVQDVNVIVLDWRSLANSLYNTAARGVPDVGVHLGNFINWLIVNGGGNLNDVHLVGFSLGAHVVGNAGRTLGGRVARITGLDPAGPTWGGNDQALRPSDGIYVEAIHTDGGMLGIFDRVADADFYPNGGRNAQPGCWVSTCSHGRAWELYAATVRYDHLVGRQCSDLRQARNNQCDGAELSLGNANLFKRGSGIYGLSTDRSYPF